MAAMYAIKIADRKRAGAARIGMGKSAKYLH
jgi:hypothetical protein